MRASSLPPSPHNAWLLAAGAASLGIAVLHIAIIFVGARGYAYFGAGDLAVLALRGSNYPAFITSLITFVFVVWAAFAASGAGLLPSLPFLRPALAAITLVYCLRGLVVVLDLIRLSQGAPYPPRHAVFSGVALFVGLLHARGLAQLVRERHQRVRAA